MNVISQNNKQEDLPDEEWRDVSEYDGYYQISNFGRVRSLDRLLNNGRLIKGRVLKQVIVKGIASVKFSVDAKAVTRRPSILVADAFLRERQPNEVVAHRNKVKYDDQLSNLIILTESESHKLDYKLGICNDWGIKSVAIANQEAYQKEYYIYEGTALKAIICTNCRTERPLTAYYSSGNKRQRQCKYCQITKQGGEAGKLEYRKELFNAGLRICSVCKKTKRLDTDFCKSKKSFGGRSNNCKACAKISNDISNAKRRKNQEPVAEEIKHE